MNKIDDIRKRWDKDVAIEYVFEPWFEGMVLVYRNESGAITSVWRIYGTDEHEDWKYADGNTEDKLKTLIPDIQTLLGYIDEIESGGSSASELVVNITADTSNLEDAMKSALEQTEQFSAETNEIAQNIINDLADRYTESHPDSKRFYEIMFDLLELHDRKQRDYGRYQDPFANVRAARNWGVKPSMHAMLRMSDKFTRLQSLAQNGELANESIEDSLRDIAVYAAITLVLLEKGE